MEENPEIANDLSDDIQSVLKVIETHNNYLNEQNIEGVMGTLHNMSPVKVSMRQMLSQMFSKLRIRNEPIETTCIGNDEDYIYIKHKQKVIKIEGPPQMRDSITTSLIAARKDGNDWKVWSVMPPLEIAVCEASANVTS